MTPGSRLTSGEHTTKQTFMAAIYTPAQLDVFTRASFLARRQMGLDPPAEDDSGRG
ncbi:MULTISPECIES: hypothetical protein [Micromonospora]|uniref:hypothetical protein n=1 Tax=Micromonospora TaxID=1873 RepID=UPI0019AADF6F|nr:hypothetical protein [Micromonospora yangpuensis]GGL92583.1 hypothetical protein GCM10012279_07810 [Micromonospora yangpuensis]